VAEFSTASRFSLVPNGEYGYESQSSDFYFTLASILPEFWQYLMIYSSFGFSVGFLSSHVVSFSLNYSSACSSLCLESGNSWRVQPQSASKDLAAWSVCYGNEGV